MEKYINALKEHYAQDPLGSGLCDIDSILGRLYCCYRNGYHMDSQSIRDKFTDLDSILSKLSLEDNNALFIRVVDLCCDHQELAFYEGIKVGFHLSRELRP